MHLDLSTQNAWTARHIQNIAAGGSQFDNCFVDWTIVAMIVAAFDAASFPFRTVDMIPILGRIDIDVRRHDAGSNPASRISRRRTLPESKNSSAMRRAALQWLL